MTRSEITIHETPIPCTEDRWPIHRPLFLRDNPRIYSSCLADYPNFDSLIEQKQQKIIYGKLIDEPSVKTLIPDIEHHGGLIEPILIRHDREEVIEGNSRLAAYRYLYNKDKDDKWKFISCRIVSSLTDDQVATLLHSIHVKGKTSWQRYEKANFIYIQHKLKGKAIKDVANLFSISSSSAYQDVRIIQAMKENNDSNRTHFSHYKVIETTLKKQLIQKPHLKSVLLSMIRPVDGDDGKGEPPFTAQNLRDQLPVVIKKPKILGKFMRGDIDLDTAYDRAKISTTHLKLKKIRDILKDITRAELLALEINSQKPVVYECGKIGQEIRRINKILAGISK